MHPSVEMFVVNEDNKTNAFVTYINKLLYHMRVGSHARLVRLE